MPVIGTGDRAVNKQTPCSHEYYIIESRRQLLNMKIDKDHISDGYKYSAEK